MVDSPLGPIKKRIKTDVRLPQAISRKMDEMCEALGVNRNVFLTLGVARMCVEFAPMQKSTRKRRSLLREIRQSFNNIVDELEKEL